MFLAVKRYPTTACGYRIELAKKSQLPELQKFLRDNFHSEETIAKCLKSQIDLTEEELKLTEEEEDRMVATTYDNSACLVAMSNKTNEIVGAILTLMTTRTSADQKNASTMSQLPFDQYRSQFMAKYGTYLTKMDEQVDILNKYPEAEAVIEFYIISVSKEHRKKGLAKDLSLAAIEVAKCMPSRTVVFGMYTSIYSRKVGEQIGMQHVMDFDLAKDFTDSKGEYIFRDTVPNNVVSAMAMLVVPDNE